MKHRCFLVLLLRFCLIRSSYFTKKWDSIGVTLSFSHTLQSDSNVTIYNKFTLYWVHIASNSTNSSKPDTGLLFGLVHCTYALTGCQRDIICTKIVQTIATQDGGRMHWSPPMASWLIFSTGYRFWARDKRMRTGSVRKKAALVTLAYMNVIIWHSIHWLFVSRAIFSGMTFVTSQTKHKDTAIWLTLWSLLNTR